MRQLVSRLSILFSFLCLATAKGVAHGTNHLSSPLTFAVITNYCAILHAGYEDSANLGRRLETSIGRFLENPQANTLQAARQSWIQCRAIYLQTEMARFCEGPIEAVESLINAWPIDENYIDYNLDDPSAGLINQPDQFPKICRETLLEVNEKGGEKNISLGFHAIEFLLWGQDLMDNGPGNRPASDFQLTNPAQKHADRRREYLRVAASLLVEHLQKVEQAWRGGDFGNYRAEMLKLPPSAALAAIFTGVGSFSGAELGGERLLVPYATKEQEDEHSCFSDTTHLDFIHDQMGIQNIFTGRFTRANGLTVEGPGILALVESVDAKLAATLRAQIEEGLTAFKSIPAPFDQALQGRDKDPGRLAIKRAIDAMQAQTTSIAKAAQVLGLRLSLK